MAKVQAHSLAQIQAQKRMYGMVWCKGEVQQGSKSGSGSTSLRYKPGQVQQGS